jgi:SAM-dependent methyltransferase
MSTWNELFKQEEFRWQKPHDHVVDFVPLLKRRGVRRVLDLGCGAGRHTVYLAREGFEVCGVDIADIGLEHTRAWLARENLSAELKHGDIEQIPYPDAYFDAVLSIYVIYHKTLAGMRRCVAEANRVLGPGGLVLISLQSKRGYRYREGVEIEPCTFVSESGPDAGELHHYSDLAEIESLFDRFVIRRIDLEERDEPGQRHSHWQVLAEKECG